MEMRLLTAQIVMQFDFKLAQGEEEYPVVVQE